MELEKAVQILIYIHAFFGAVGLIAGLGSVLAKKGSRLHKNMGKFFVAGMLTSTLISIPITQMPNHQNLFLFLIGLFTIYLVLGGVRAIKFKTMHKAGWVDWLISGGMLIFSIFMVVFGVYKIVVGQISGVLYVFFGGFGLFLTILDILFYKNPSATKNAWLAAHLRKMNGALIASITAFLVAGLGFMNLAAWVLPSVLGTFYIIYWKRKIQGKKTALKA